jgi:hypothetical protein
MRCSVCKHPARAEIDSSLVGEVENSVVAQRFGLGRESVRRHRESHIPQALAVAQKAHDVARADDLLGKVAEMEANARTALARAEGIAASSKDNPKTALEATRTALLALREMKGQLELLAKLRGELDESTKIAVVVTNSPEWVNLRTKIIQALEPFPEARQAVADALKEDAR